MAHELKRTGETMTEEVARAFYEVEPDEAVEDRIETHDGAWIREGTLWRWWKVKED